MCLHSSVFIMNDSAAFVAGQSNVLCNHADDMLGQFGGYGHTTVKTPNLKRLCGMGVPFDVAHCQQTLRSANRASIRISLQAGTRDTHTLKHELREKHLRGIYPDNHFGNAFEKLCKWDLLNSPQFSQKVSKVWRTMYWPSWTACSADGQSNLCAINNWSLH